jgi:hypothetical protein
LTFVRKVCIIISMAQKSQDFEKGLRQMTQATIVPMKMEKKYIRRRRVAFALAVVLAVSALVGLYEVVSNLWWVGNGYCWGEFDKCYGLGK